MDKSVHYDWCVNCIAYTDTKSEESTEEGKIAGYRLNALLPGYIAQACAEHGTRLIHISTDYVFSEHAVASFPVAFCPWDTPFPKNQYGMHKLIGEMAIRNVMKEKDYAILRTSWLYSTNNCKSFIHKFLKNCILKYNKAADEKPVKVEVTSNEHSVPTSCRYLVECIDKAVRGKMRGVHHAVPNRGNGLAEGPSRYDFAAAILESIIKAGISTELAQIFSGISLAPVENTGYYPKNSALCSTTGIPGDWRQLLDDFICRNIKHIEDYCTRILDGKLDVPGAA